MYSQIMKHVVLNHDVRLSFMETLHMKHAAVLRIHDILVWQLALQNQF